MDGRGHRRQGKKAIVVTTIIIVVTYAIAKYIGVMVPDFLLPYFSAFGFFFYFGLWLGLHITPDYDLAESQVYPLNRIQKKYGLLGWMWRAYWYPYGILCPHRGFSHARGWGTLFRFIWAFWWVIILAWSMVEVRIIDHATWPAVCLLATFLGMWLQDDNHLFHDGML